MPDGYDVKSVKGCKSKGWQDTKLFFVTRIPIPEIIEAMEDITASSKRKGQGCTQTEGRADADSDDDVCVESSTRSKKQKVTRKIVSHTHTGSNIRNPANLQITGLSNSDDDYVMLAPLEKVEKDSTQPRQ
ncbi:hypothetical protein JB92DRAFT_3134968 [Gautieria morchelliformis]|nr:hypothetical protein JB92DRAFT_3134968 [Gautieria morchelliformis]